MQNALGKRDPLSVKLPPLATQPDLFPDLVPDKVLGRTGEARCRFGKVVEELVTGLLGLTDIPNSGTHDVVFDAQHRPSGAFCEIKSLRRGNKLPIYDFRRQKDRDSGVPLVYVIGIHDCAKCATLGGVWLKMTETLDTVLVLPPAVIDGLAEAEPLKMIGTEKTASGKRNGYQREGYKDGYRNLPWEKLMAAANGFTRVREAKVRGLWCVSQIKYHPSLQPWL